MNKLVWTSDNRISIDPPKNPLKLTGTRFATILDLNPWSTQFKVWKTCVEGGISPAFDEKKDADILKVLRTNTLNPETDIESVLEEAEALQEEIDKVNESIADKESRLKTLKDIIKKHAIKSFRNGDKSVALQSKRYIWNVSCSVQKDIDKEALKADGLLDKYNTKSTTTYRLTNKLI